MSDADTTTRKRKPRAVTTIRLSTYERARYGARAKSQGMSLSAYLRRLAQRDCDLSDASRQAIDAQGVCDG